MPLTQSLLQLFAEHDVVLLDGATGTELELRGLPAPLPLWTADAAHRAPELLHQVHRDYLEAGADLVTANTFRTTPYTLRKLGRESEAASLTAHSVEIALAACREFGRGLVAGCMAPLEDCYHPERVRPGEELRREHAVHARNLADAGADLLLVETMGTSREAHAAAEAALGTGLPVLVSFILDPAGEGDLLSGEDLEVVFAHLRALEVGGRQVAGCLVNCTPREVILAALERMVRDDDARPVGAYPNNGVPDAEVGWKRDPVGTAQSFAAWAESARSLGARLFGGCCGTTPEDLRSMAQALGR